jgi:hypothetical protein
MMNGHHGSKREQEHWRIRELLARYAEKEQAGEDAAQMYPEVAEHLKRCASCRAALSLTLMGEAAGDPTPDRRITPLDLPFIQRPDSVHHSLRPESTCSDFSLHITLPCPDLSRRLSPAAGVMRSQGSEGFGPIQPGGRLLLVDTFAVGDEDVYVLLTLHSGQQPSQYTLVGEIAGESLPPSLTARLQIGHRVFFADLADGVVKFEEVTFLEDADSITLTLETPV